MQSIVPAGHDSILEPVLFVRDTIGCPHYWLARGSLFLLLTLTRPARTVPFSPRAAPMQVEDGSAALRLPTDGGRRITCQSTSAAGAETQRETGGNVTSGLILTSDCR